MLSGYSFFGGTAQYFKLPGYCTVLYRVLNLGVDQIALNIVTYFVSENEIECKNVLTSLSVVHHMQC